MNLKEKKSNIITPSSDQTINAYLKEINKYKVLTATEEADLVDKMRNGDEEAKNKLIASNQRFVYAVAKRFGNENNILDLVQAGNIGLMQAIETFDPSKGNRLLSYAIWYIRREVNAYLNNDNVLVRKTNNTKLVYKVNKIKSQFFSEHNRYPNVDEMAKLLEEKYGLKIKDKTDLWDVTTTSINTCFDDEDVHAFENSPYFTERTAVENEYLDEMDKEHKSSVSDRLMSVLSEREQTIIKLAFGIGCNQEFTNAEIAEDIGMSSERVRQLKNGAIEKMKKLAVAEHLSF